MVYTLSALGGALLSNVVIVLAFLRVARVRDREWGRRFDLVVNQLLHATNHTWAVPPVDDWQPEPEHLEAGRYVSAPEQLADL